MIRITSKRAGFRRCGMPHPKEPVDYPDDRFTRKELKILEAESMLIVEVIPNEPVDELEEPGPEETVASEETQEDIKEVETGEDPVVAAARQAVEAGKVTREGKPKVEAIEEILGREISGKDRDAAWEKLDKT